MSKTEEQALAAGDTGYEAEIFSGMPNWNKLHKLSKNRLTTEEQEFLDGPVHQVCEMVDDWEVTHKLFDLPDEIWEFIKINGFFGLIIPKSYGGKEFSATAHSEIILYWWRRLRERF